MEVLNPQGPVGVHEAAVLTVSFLAMMLVVIPIIFMTIFFAWRYRASAPAARYAPRWTRSVPLELAIWGVPLAIVTFLGVVSWRSTQALDPYKRLDVPGAMLTVDVVALDWKWLFIYPAQNIASVNQLVIPAGRQIEFNITSDTVMNVFFIPQLGSQIYAMAGMRTELHLLAKNKGNYAGISANFSGPGYADMRFETRAVSANDFANWIKRAQAVPLALNAENFAQLAGASKNNPVMLFGKTDPALFDDIIGAHRGGVSKLPSMATE